MALDDSLPVPRHPLPKRPVVDPTTTVSGLMPHGSIQRREEIVPGTVSVGMDGCFRAETHE